MLRRTLLLLFAFALLALPASAQSDGQVDIIALSGVLDPAKVEYATTAINRAVDEGAVAVILELDSPGAVTDTSGLEEALSSAPLTTVVWVGDAPARAFGAAARLLNAADIAAAAPGTLVGHGEIERIGSEATLDGAPFAGEPVLVETGTAGFDRVEASLGQIVVWLDGQTIKGTTLETAKEVTDDDGQVRLQQTVDVRFVEPNLWVRILDSSLSPAALFFFLAAGLTVVAFEFYAIGPGVAAGTSLLPLLVAGYGLAQLPVTLLGIVALLVAMWLLVADYQGGGFRLMSWLGIILLAVSGYFLVDGSPTLPPSWGGIAATTITVALFFSIAMPVVARSRFSTGTFGRDHLIGRAGIAVGPFVEGTGTVDLGGAHWKAAAHREARIGDGDELIVAAVQGLWLEVERPETAEAAEA